MPQERPQPAITKTGLKINHIKFHGNLPWANELKKYYSYLTIVSGGKYHEQIQIEENSTGHSYEAIMGRFIEPHLTAVEVDDPYIRSNHQVGELTLNEKILRRLVTK